VGLFGFLVCLVWVVLLGWFVDLGGVVVWCWRCLRVRVSVGGEVCDSCFGRLSDDRVGGYSDRWVREWEVLTGDVGFLDWAGFVGGGVRGR
jgi:hypothetical protein